MNEGTLGAGAKSLTDGDTITLRLHASQFSLVFASSKDLIFSFGWNSDRLPLRRRGLAGGVTNDGLEVAMILHGVLIFVEISRRDFTKKLVNTARGKGGQISTFC